LTFAVKAMALLTVIASGVGIAGPASAVPAHRAPIHLTSAHHDPVASVDDFLTPGDSHPQPAPTAAPMPEAPPAEPPSGATAPFAAAPAPPPAPPAIVIGSGQQALINQDRAVAGLPPLNWSGCLASIAAGQARVMAASGSIFHGNGVQQDWGCGLGSSQTAENVGVWGSGINDAGINQLFMASAPHRADIMGPYHYVGTAWVVSSTGKGYIAVEFA
jgi:uncharacterized protein YkwD